MLIEGPAQLILVDTPGLFDPKRRLDRAMVTTTWERARQADLVCLVVDHKTALQPRQGRWLNALAIFVPQSFDDQQNRPHPETEATAACGRTQ